MNKIDEFRRNHKSVVWQTFIFNMYDKQWLRIFNDALAHAEYALKTKNFIFVFRQTP